MTSAIFPVIGAWSVIVVVLPMCAGLARVALWLLERIDARGLLHGLGLRYVILVGSSALPLMWFVSAGAHQAESGYASALICLLTHDASECGREPGLFVLALACIAIALGLRASLKNRVRHPLDTSDELLQSRIARTVDAHASLHALRGRVRLTDQPGYAVATHGLVAPLVFVGVAFAKPLADDELAAALGHERGHVAARDPLRYFILELALALNPVGAFLLRQHASRWRAAREAHCDREAVVEGLDPLALASAILAASRPTPTAYEAVALGARREAFLAYRVGMLLAFDEQPPVRCCRPGPTLLIAMIAVTTAVVLPHRTGGAALDVLHRGVERGALSTWH